MKVALLTDGIWPFVIGGMQRHSHMLCKPLAAHAVDVVLLHPQMDEQSRQTLKDLFTQQEWAHIRWMEVNKPRTHRFPGHYVYESYQYARNAWKTLEASGEQVDFVYAKGLTGWYALRHKKKDFPPIGINIHGYEFVQRQANWKERMNARMLYRPFRYINRKADYVFSYGGAITSYAVQLGVARQKIIEIPGAVDDSWITQQLLPKSGRRKFIFVGRYERRKGIQELTGVVQELLRTFDFEFHFVGAIGEALQLKDPRVTYHGVLKTREAIVQLLDAAHVLVCPSYSEGMPNVILEAMSRGCPAIASNVGAVSLMVNEDTGWLIEPASYQSLKKAMEAAIHIPNHRLQIKSAKALELIKNKFTWNSVGKLTVETLQRLSAR